MITSKFSGQVLSGRGTVREIQATYLGRYQGRKMIVISNHKVYFAVTVCRKQRVQAVKNGKTDHHSWQGQRHDQDQLEDLEKVVMINEEAKKFSTTTVIKDNRMVEEYGVDEIDDIIANTSNSEKVAQTKDITADMQEKYKGKPSEGHLMLEIFARNKQIQQLLTSMMNIAQQKEENNIQLNDVKDRLAEIREVTPD